MCPLELLPQIELNLGTAACTNLLHQFFPKEDIVIYKMQCGQLDKSIQHRVKTLSFQEENNYNQTTKRNNRIAWHQLLGDQQSPGWSTLVTQPQINEFASSPPVCSSASHKDAHLQSRIQLAVKTRVQYSLTKRPPTLCCCLQYKSSAHRFRQSRHPLLRECCTWRHHAMHHHSQPSAGAFSQPESKAGKPQPLFEQCK